VRTKAPLPAIPRLRDGRHRVEGAPVEGVVEDAGDAGDLVVEPGELQIADLLLCQGSTNVGSNACAEVVFDAADAGAPCHRVRGEATHQEPVLRVRRSEIIHSPRHLRGEEVREAFADVGPSWVSFNLLTFTALRHRSCARTTIPTCPTAPRHSPHQCR
jgi:hypothetical protein